MVKILLVIVFSYILGSIPFGFIIGHIARGKDVRTVGSGRTGATNVMRAAGFFAGFLTMTLDVLKGAASALLVSWLAPGTAWLQVLAALAVVAGHNYSVFLLEKNEKGNPRLRGGAGGTPAIGGAIALWPQSAVIVIPVALCMFLLVGYASVATMSVGVTSTIIFLVRAGMGFSPWVFVAYGVVVEAMILWALRPNLQRLREGTEREVGLRAYLKKKKSSAP